MITARFAFRRSTGKGQEESTWQDLLLSDLPRMIKMNMLEDLQRGINKKKMRCAVIWNCVRFVTHAFLG